VTENNSTNRRKAFADVFSTWEGLKIQPIARAGPEVESKLPRELSGLTGSERVGGNAQGLVTLKCCQQMIKENFKYQISQIINKVETCLTMKTLIYSWVWV